MTSLLTNPLPVDGVDLRADGLAWTGLFDPAILAAIGGALLVVAFAVLAVWSVLRRVCRSALAGHGRELTALGRELSVQGSAALVASRLQPGGRRTAARLRLEVSRAPGRLGRQMVAARASGALSAMC